MTAQTKTLLLCLCAVGLIAPTRADETRRRQLRGGSQQNVLDPKRNQSSTGKGKTVWDWIQSDGVLIKMLTIDSATFDKGDVLINADVINDCTSTFLDPPDNYGIPHCSAWAFMKQGLVPMVYNYPPQSQHQVGIVVANSQAVTEAVTRMHVIDGITIGRYSDGADRVDVGSEDWDACKDTALNRRYVCAYEDIGPRHCADDATHLWAPIGSDGSYWADQFIMDSTLQKPDFNRWHSNQQQCEFWSDSNGWTNFQNALQSYYDKVKHLSDEGLLPDFDTDADNGIYLENEVNMEKPVEDVRDLLLGDGQPLLAVIVQDNMCYDQLPASARERCSDYYTNEDNENSMRHEAVATACRLRKQIQDNHHILLPVLNASGVLTNSIPDADRWQQYRESTDPRDWLSANEIDCEKYSQQD